MSVTLPEILDHIMLSDGQAFGAAVVGVGLLAARDVAAWLKYGGADMGHPCADGMAAGPIHRGIHGSGYPRIGVSTGATEPTQDAPSR